MSNIEQNLQKILSSRYGKDVRQSIHDSIHDCYEDGKAGAVDLVAREQIANLVANNNPTEGNSELVDIRAGYDGTTYTSAGESVRGQVSSLKEDLNDINTIIYNRKNKDLIFEYGTVEQATGDMIDNENNKRIRTSKKVDFYDGDIIKSNSKYVMWLAFFDKDFKYTGYSGDWVSSYKFTGYSKAVIILKSKNDSPFSDGDLTNAENLMIYESKILEKEVVNKNTNMSNLVNYSYSQEDIEWENCGIYSNSGLTYKTNDRIVTKNYINTNIRRIIAMPDYEIVYFAYNDDDSIYTVGTYVDEINSLSHNKKIKIVAKRKDNQNISLDESSNIIFITHNSLDLNSIIISASDSTDECKRKSDFVCDGLNDEEQIQLAINYFGKKGLNGEIILCDGNYNIDSFMDLGPAGKYCIGILQPEKNRTVTIRGLSTPKRGDSNYEIHKGAALNLNLNLCESMSSDDVVNLIGVAPNYETLERNYPNIFVNISNIAINIPKQNKKIIGINVEHASTASISNITMSAYSKYSDDQIWYSDPSVINKDLIGMRLIKGENWGTGYEVKNCFIFGFGIGFDIGGEHLIMSECGSRYCIYPYRFSGYQTNNEDSHPNTLINCCEEICQKGIYFATSRAHQTINLIDYNIEVRTTEYNGNFPRSTGAVEETPGSFRGTITYSANRESYVNADDIPFWEPGSGINVLTRNTSHKFAGATSERPQSPNIMESYYDKEINKIIFYNGTNWIDCMGKTI